MKFYLLFYISLTLANRIFARNIEFSNTESTLNTIENTLESNTESTLNFTEKIVTSNTESTLNSTEKKLSSNNESSLNSTNKKVTSNTESTLNSTERILTWNTESTLNPTEKTATPSLGNISTTKTEPECPENMMSSPWRSMAISVKCYCMYPFLPLPVNNTCFELFMQGPCEPGNFLVQPTRDKQWNLPLPRCAPNPCIEDGLIPYKGTCHNIITDPICEDGNLYFRELTSEVKCQLLMHPRTSLNAPSRKCSDDSRLDRNGICRKKL